VRGSVTKKRGLYYIVVDLDRGADGQRQQKWISGPGNHGWARKRDAEAELPRTMDKLRNGRPLVDRDDLTMAVFLDRWLRAKQPNVSYRTYKAYESAVRVHIAPFLGTVALGKLKPTHIQEFILSLLDKPVKNIWYKGPGEDGRERTLGATQVRYIFSVLVTALEQAVGWELLMRNPCQSVEPPRPKRYRPSVLTELDAAQMIRAVSGTDLFVPVMLGLTCGLRSGEICGLRWPDIDLEAGILHVSKGMVKLGKGQGYGLDDVKTCNSRRAVDVPESFIEVLKAERKAQLSRRMHLGPYYHTEDFVWCNGDGSPHSPYLFYVHFKKMLTENGLPDIRVHDLRHSCATILLKNGVDLKVVQERLGHAQASFTMQAYVHLLPGMQKKAASIMDAIATGDRSQLKALKKSRG
jgi:integrase